MKTFSEKVKEARTILELTQDELAERIGVTRRTVISYETEGKFPRKKMLFNLAHALNVSVKYLSDENCENPHEDIELDELAEEAYVEHGSAGATDLVKFLQEGTAFFAGGDISPEQKEAVLGAFKAAFDACTAAAHEKFTPKSVKKKKEEN